jgi:hypothetical protein
MRCKGTASWRFQVQVTRWFSCAAAVFAALLSSLACVPDRGAETTEADFVLLGGKVVTMDPALPEAEAVAASNGRLVFVGTDAGAREWIGEQTEVVDAAGALVVPGFIEGHGHFSGLGEMRLQLDLTDALTWDEIVAMVATAAREAAGASWILGRGWHQSKWRSSPHPVVEGAPVHDTLSAVSGDHPVLLTHASGHAAFANARALELAGIDATTANPPGGEIVRDASGRATGLLRETAQSLVAAQLDRSWNEERERRIVALAAGEALAKGVTSFQDAGSSVERVGLYRRMAREGALPLRLWVMLREPNDVLAEHLAALRLVDDPGGYLAVRGIKKAIDGALGSHGAWLLEPYVDLPGSSGLNTTELAEIERAADLAIEHGYQLCVHAIGDRANRETLDLFARAFERHGVDGRELRWRIEHAQHLHPDDVPRFSQLGVVASMQAVHATSDGPWVPDRIGMQRAQEGAYVWRDLLDAGAIVTNGTDTPVEDVAPLASFYAAVSRRMQEGETFFPEQRMTREEALAAYTLDAAYAAFEEHDKGSLEVGKLADLTVLSKNILTVPEEEILDATVLYTIVGGKVRFAASP